MVCSELDLLDHSPQLLRQHFVPLCCDGVEMAAFLSLRTQPLLTFSWSSANSLPLSAFLEVETVRPCSGLGFGLRECWGCFDLLCRPLELSISSQAVLLSYHLCVPWSGTFNFLQRLVFCIHNWAPFSQLLGSRGLARLSTYLPGENVHDTSSHLK